MHPGLSGIGKRSMTLQTLAGPRLVGKLRKEQPRSYLRAQSDSLERITRDGAVPALPCYVENYKIMMNAQYVLPASPLRMLCNTPAHKLNCTGRIKFKTCTPGWLPIIQNLPWLGRFRFALHQWHHEPSRFVPLHVLTPNVQAAVCHQDGIGWHQFLLGRLSFLFAETQDA